MLRLVWIFLLLQTALFSLEIDNRSSFNELLSHSEIYKDSTRTESISTIQNKNFEPNRKTILTFGYSPNFDVWIKFKLTNNTDNRVEKIIEYTNPLTTHIDFFEEQNLKKRDGLLNVSKDRFSLNPILKVTLEPHQSKVFFIKASSNITTLIIELNLWSPERFFHHDISNQMKLNFLLGAMIIMLFYNFLVFIKTRELTHLYLILFFATVTFHHSIYKGIATIHLPLGSMSYLINCFSCIVAIPIIFLALFTQRILELKQYPIVNNILNSLLILYPIVIIVISTTETHQYRSLFLAIILLYLFIVSIYALLKRNRQAYFVFISLILFETSGIFMYLSSLGIYDLFIDHYYGEIAWLLVIVIFSSKVLTSKMNALQEEKRGRKINEILLKEAKHRATNNIQTILNLLLFQKENMEDKKIKEVLTDFENRVIATTKVSSLLEKDMSRVNIDEHLSLITENIKKGFKQEYITINIHNNIATMDLENIKYCSLIINEAVTNAFKHAFKDSSNGEIDILLNEKGESYHLTIKDNGSGFRAKVKDRTEGGLYLIELLAIWQLRGSLKIKKENGVEIDIVWRKSEKR